MSVKRHEPHGRPVEPETRRVDPDERALLDEALPAYMREGISDAIEEGLTHGPISTWGAVLADASQGERTRDATSGKSGRPGWDPDEFWRRWAKAEAATPEPRTAQRIAEHFVALDGTVGVDHDYLRALRRKHRSHRPG